VARKTRRSVSCRARFPNHLLDRIDHDPWLVFLDVVAGIRDPLVDPVGGERGKRLVAAIDPLVLGGQLGR
jgi:hypothetical protein